MTAKPLEIVSERNPRPFCHNDSFHKISRVDGAQASVLTALTILGNFKIGGFGKTRLNVCTARVRRRLLCGGISAPPGAGDGCESSTGMRECDLPFLAGCRVPPRALRPHELPCDLSLLARCVSLRAQSRWRDCKAAWDPPTLTA